MSQPVDPEARRCPICGTPQDRNLRPFCSKPCADIDLAKWFGGGYAIPAAEDEERGDETEGGAGNED
ncbi:MAG TPA: DNA gyrase inhibitor YacG [Rhizomicrobium sp.]|jgi:hypothetical protein|nr:DNA gyrase inhibitor YacG [Rhizomicrobium sp.]